MLLSIDGDAAHDVVRQLLDQAGVELRAITFKDSGEVEEEGMRKLYHYKGYDYEVSGRCDAEIATPHGWAVLEVKSIWHYGWEYFQKAWGKDGGAGVVRRIAEKYPSWWYQAHFMMDMRKLPKWYLILKDRNFGRVGFGPEGVPPGGAYIDFNPKILDEALDRLFTIERALETGEPPQHGYLAGSWQCNTCKWGYRCREAESREQRGLEPFMKYPLEGLE